MWIDLLRDLWNAIKNRGFNALGWARKGLEALLSLLGRGRKLVGPLLKKVLTLFMAKGSAAVKAVRGKLGGTYESLSRMAKAAMNHGPPETGTIAESEDLTEDIGEPETAECSDVAENDAVADPQCEFLEAHDAPPAAAAPREKLSAREKSPLPPNSSDEARPLGRKAAKQLAAIAPLIGKALARTAGKERLRGAAGRTSGAGTLSPKTMFEP